MDTRSSTHPSISPTFKVGGPLELPVQLPDNGIDHFFDIPATIPHAGNLPFECECANLNKSMSESQDDDSLAGDSHALSNSARPYNVRAKDPRDFASLWEEVLVPTLDRELRPLSPSGFSVDVHTFPEFAKSSIPRVIFISTAEELQASSKLSISEVVTACLPGRFSSTRLIFHQGSMERSAHWLGTNHTNLDKACSPKHTAYRPSLALGVSIGSEWSDDTASLGGFIQIGENTYATSVFHAFEDTSNAGNLTVCHPSDTDHRQNWADRVSREQMKLGEIQFVSGANQFRPSTVYQGVGQSPSLTLVEMDWVAIRIAGRGNNVLPIPRFPDMDRQVKVSGYAEVKGNIEVYAMGRTSGYSLSFTSDVPGLQYFNKAHHREWTVRQYSPGQCGQECADQCCNDLRWQTVKEWITSGIGAPGDSGAWLVRRSDDHVIGHVWGRQTCYGPIDSVKRNRLTYFTPFVDMKADIEEVSREEVSFPAGEPNVAVHFGEVDPLRLATRSADDPWTSLAMEPAGMRRESELTVIRNFCHQNALSLESLRPLIRGTQPDFSEMTVTAVGATDGSDSLGSSVQPQAISAASSDERGMAEYPLGRRKIVLETGSECRGLSNTPSLVLSCPTALTVDSADESATEDVNVNVEGDGRFGYDDIRQLRRSKATVEVPGMLNRSSLRATPPIDYFTRILTAGVTVPP